MATEIALFVGVFVCAVLFCKIMLLQSVKTEHLWIIPFVGAVQFAYGLFGLYIQSCMQTWILFSGCPKIVYWITTIVLLVTSLAGIGQATTICFYYPEE